MCKRAERRDNEMRDFVNYPVNWLTGEQQEELHRSGLEPKQWFQRKFGMSGNRWLRNLKQNLEPEVRKEMTNSIRSLAPRNTRGKTSQSPLSVVNKEIDEKLARCQAISRVLKEMAQHSVKYLHKDGTTYEAVITFMNRELQLNEIRFGHKAPLCPFREECLDFAVLHLAKSFSCINCSIRSQVELLKYD